MVFHGEKKHVVVGVTKTKVEANQMISRVSQDYPWGTFSTVEHKVETEDGLGDG